MYILDCLLYKHYACIPATLGLICLCQIQCNRFTVLNMYQKPPEDECHRSFYLKPFSSVSRCPLRNFKIERAVMVVPIGQVTFSTVFMSARNICHLSVLQRSFESELQPHSCEGQQINHSAYRHTEQHINRVIQRFECPTFGLLNEKDLKKLSKQHLSRFGQAMALRCQRITFC